MSEEYWKEKTEYWRTLLDQKDARIAELEFLLERAKTVARGCVEVMEMQEKRESGDFHIPAHTFRPMWDSAKLKAREL